MSDQNPPADFRRSALVPELVVSDLDSSRRFWCGLCGFRVAYERVNERFVYLDLSGRQFMLEQADTPGRHWITGPLEPPFGRGINFQIAVEDITPIVSALKAAGWPLYLEPEEIWYGVGDQESGVRQFLVQDPDGYLLRFGQSLGMRRRRDDRAEPIR